jgi:hypothetical protein
MTVRDGQPENHARVLVRLGSWTDRWEPATAHQKPDGLLWRFDTAGWQPTHPADEWVLATMATEGTT